MQPQRAAGGRSGDRGAVIPLVALILPVLVTMTAFSVDLGRQRLSGSAMQAVADVIALDMARLADGRSAHRIAVVDAAATEAALAASAARNGVDRAVVASVVWGSWAPGSGFRPYHQPGFAPADDPSQRPNAVEITTSEVTDYYFQPGSGWVTRRAVGTIDEAAWGQIGSGLVRMDTNASAILTTVLLQAFGVNSGADVGVLDYNGLAGATVGLDELAARLGFGSPQELASAEVALGDLLLGAAAVLDHQGQLAAAEIYRWFGTRVRAGTMIEVGDLLALGHGGPEGALAGGVDAFSLLTAAAYVINGANTISVPTLTTGVAGVTGVAMSLTVTQPPVVWGSREGDSTTTQQVNLSLSARVDLPLSVPGLVGARVTGTIPVRVAVAGARGTIADIDCSSAPGITLTAEGRPVTVESAMQLEVRARVNLLVGQVDAVVAQVGVLPRPRGLLTGASGARFRHPVDFLPPVGQGRMVHAPGTSLGLSHALAVSDAHVRALGVLPIDPASLSPALNAALAPVLDQLGAFTVELAAQLGVDVGGSDLAAVSLTCDRVKLVG